MGTPKLRVGVLLDSKTVPAWTFRILESIAQSDCAQLSLIVVANRDSASEGFLSKLWRNRNKLVYFLYSRLDSMLFPVSPDAFAPRGLNYIANKVDTIEVTPIEKGFSDYFPDEAVSRIEEAKLDVVLRFGFNILRGGILGVAKHGVWSYHHGDNQRNRGSPAGMWEVLEGWPETGSILQILTEQLDGGQVIYRSWSRTNPYSVAKNKNSYYWKSSEFVMRNLQCLHKDGAEYFFAAKAHLNADQAFYDRPLYRPPGNLHATFLVIRQAFRLARRAIDKLIYTDQWILIYRFSDGLATSLRQFKTLRPPKDRFWADPFIVHRDDKYYVFLEEYLEETGRAHISVMELDEDGSASEPVEILSRPYHLSYPSLFEWNDRLFMIPESMANRSVELYECVEFPYKWEFVHYIMEDVKSADSTMFEHDGKWWLFSGWANVDGMSHDDELVIHYADNPLSTDWQPHALNPVVSDVRNARPAGRIDYYGDRLMRPAQNCAGIYGYGFNLNEITKLSETEYEEHTVAKITPSWDRKITRTHTLNHAGKLTIGDAMKQRWKFF